MTVPYNGPILLALGALSAPDAATRRELLDAAEARAAAGAMAPAVIALHCFALECAALDDDPAGGRRHAASLEAVVAAEPLGLTDLTLRAAALRFGAEAPNDALEAMRHDLASAHLAGLAGILQGVLTSPHEQRDLATILGTS